MDGERSKAAAAMKTNMAKVLYYNANLVGKAFDVLKENPDGTVDIGTDDRLAVRSCAVAIEPKHGYAVRCLAPGEASKAEGAKKSENDGQKTDGGASDAPKSRAGTAK